MRHVYIVCILCTWLDLPVDGPEGREGADGLIAWYRSDHPSLSVDNVHLPTRFEHGKVVLVNRRPELPIKIAGESSIDYGIAYTFLSDW